MPRLSDELIETARRLRAIEDLTDSADISDELRSVLQAYVKSLRDAVTETHDRWASALVEAFRREDGDG